MSATPRRDFFGRRVLVNLSRAAHLVGVVGVGAGLLSGLSPASWLGYTLVLVASGVAMMLLDGWSDPAYYRQLTALAIYLKVALLGVMVYWLASPAAFWVVLVFSAMVSHAPSKWRHRRWWP